MLSNWKFAIMFFFARAISSVRSFTPSTSTSRSLLQHQGRALPRLFSTASSTQILNLLTIEKEELEHHIQAWGYPKYRADQVWKWVRTGVTSAEDMGNLPKTLRLDLEKYTKKGSLELDVEEVSKDGTRKRAYRLHDGQLIESVLMPYRDGRYTACISSQAGCAMGCVFCATGQMGFARQLTPDEILEQVALFDSELAAKGERLSNIVFMGMGEPMANYRNVKTAINRITQDLGIGARKITVSTVGVVPNIRKLISDPDMPQVRLAVSLHCASDEERTKLLPANARYGGLDELMLTLKDYIDTTNRRITLEWALIEHQNDDPETARQLGNLVRRFGIRRDMVHVNVIPLNPTGGFGGSPSGRNRVNAFCSTLTDEFGIACTPRVRRGIDIDAGCGQLKSKIEKREQKDAISGEVEATLETDQLELSDFMESPQQASSSMSPIGVYEDEEDEQEEEDILQPTSQTAEFEIDMESIDFESDDYEDPEFLTEWELQEADRLIQLVQGTSLPKAAVSELEEPENSAPTTSITDEDALREAKRRRKKLIKNLKAIDRLVAKQNEAGFEFNEEQQSKVDREIEWRAELESVEHNLQ
jgi:23S rRNA (adenine2503-C2)-methyltransferase